MSPIMYVTVVIFLQHRTVRAGETLFDFVAKRTSERVLDRRNDIETNEILDTVSAGEIWDEGRMMKLLGLEEEKGGLEYEHEDALADEDEYVEIPSILSALYNKMNDPGSNILPMKCKLPGMKGNVVRMLNNKGAVLYQSQRQSIVELRFSLKQALHEYENLTVAELKIPIPSWKSWFDADIFQLLLNDNLITSPRYKYEIFHASDLAISKLRTVIKDRKIKRINADLTDNLILDGIFGKPMITEYVTPNPMKNLRTKSLKVEPMIEKWRKIFFKSKRREISRAILVVTIETDIPFSKKCSQLLLENLRLLLVSLDKRQCPLPMTSYGDQDLRDDVSNDDVTDVTLNRHKRSTTRVKNVKSRRSKNRRKTKIENQLILGETETNTARAPGAPDLVSGKSLHTGHSRAVRSTICCRHSMYVSFEDVGWEQWIIAPRGYQAHRCEGECPFPLGGKLNGTNHAVLMTMMHSVDPWNSPQPCCVATVLNPISLLYFDTSGNVVLRQYEDMVVSACGCR